MTTIVTKKEVHCFVVDLAARRMIYKPYITHLFFKDSISLNRRTSDHASLNICNIMANQSKKDKYSHLSSFVELFAGYISVYIAAIPDIIILEKRGIFHQNLWFDDFCQFQCVRRRFSTICRTTAKLSQKLRGRNLYSPLKLQHQNQGAPYIILLIIEIQVHNGGGSLSTQIGPQPTWLL